VGFQAADVWRDGAGDRRGVGGSKDSRSRPIGGGRIGSGAPVRGRDRSSTWSWCPQGEDLGLRGRPRADERAEGHEKREEDAEHRRESYFGAGLARC
jgi:hypothetical protein